MTTLLLIRHGRTTANADRLLAGRTPGVHLDDTGRDQARAAGERIAGLPVVAVHSSPMERCLETIEHLGLNAPITIDDDLTECDYGDWSNRRLAELADEPLWQTVQTQPSAAAFPGGEAMVNLWARATRTIRNTARRIDAEHGKDAIWAAVAHGDVIKAILAEALAMHLDTFQRIVVDPASISVIRYTRDRPVVLTMNSISGDLGHLATPPDQQTQVGGGLGARG